MMHTFGKPLPRVDGRLKVMGKATYAAEFSVPDVTHAIVVSAPIGTGRVLAIDIRKTQGLPGVLGVVSHLNAPRLAYRPHKGGVDPANGERLHVLQDAEVRHWGQPVAVVIAETLEKAEHAASLVKIDYRTETPSLPMMVSASTGAVARAALEPTGSSYSANYERGNWQSALASADVRIDSEYSIGRENHNPIEPHATLARWEADRLIVYDKSQWVSNARDELAAVFGIPVENVQVICPFVGGAFGTTLRTWPHATLAAVAARHVGRPVKLVLSREQMYYGTGYRPQTLQRVRVGASRAGRLEALIHEGYAETSRYEQFTEALLSASRHLYSCANLATRYRLVPQDVHTPTFMRGPGEASGVFALESAVDELAYALGIDPIELRLRNEPQRDEERNLPYSSRALRECYVTGAERFEWRRRRAQPGTLRDGHWLIGLGMAVATYRALRSPAAAQVRLLADGSAVVETSAADMGPGTYTSLTQIACDALELAPEKVRVVIGDSSFPRAPPHGGSQTMASVGSAVLAACLSARSKATELERSGAEISVTETSRAGDEQKRYSMHAFGAVFVEVGVDADLGLVRVRRAVGAYCAGRIINPRLAHSQAIGGIVGGIGMALMERTHVDTRDGRIVNANLADYLVPVNADIPEIDVVFVDEADSHVNPLGAKGVAEIPLIGVAPAIANAVFNATGKRIRSLPILPEALLRP
jgi:xanthine dehydrogenase YagR molybdenum-binding subunit